ncbi:MAG: ATP-binding cassette domain-containing protein [Actinophytocola sp.]|nr:ATP-binding cassette domain-containing protein [Actinophytocola sp.]
MAEIVLDKVSKRYPDGVLAVSELDVSVADGEFVVLLGPPGCGKSTVLHLVAGLESISSGELRIDGVRVNEQPPWQRDLAMVFEGYALYPHLSVRENIAFPLRLAKLPDATVRARVGEVAERLDLTEQLDRRPAMLSGGQRQRVAIGRAIVRNAKALLMDEPMANLDSKLRTQLRSSVAELQRDLGITTLYVTHDQAEAMALAHRVVVLRDGAVQQTGTPRQLRETCGE